MFDIPFFWNGFDEDTPIIFGGSLEPQDVSSFDDEEFQSMEGTNFETNQHCFEADQRLFTQYFMFVLWREFLSPKFI